MVTVLSKIRVNSNLLKGYKAKHSRFVKRLAKEAADSYKSALRSRGAIASGRLQQSIGYSYDKKMIQVLGNFYGRFIDSGTRPFKPPVSALKRWSVYKTGSDMLVGRALKSISEKGTRARNISGLAIARLEKKVHEIAKHTMR